MRMGILLIFVSTLIAAISTGEPGFEISRSTIDGGGAMGGNSGDFELSGTIGQPDAGILVGGTFELYGGFWYALLPSDCNEDGGVNLLDHSALTSCLVGPTVGVTPGCNCFDVDHNGSVDLLDFAITQVSFTGM